jgi:hypothetical protein
MRIKNAICDLWILSIDAQVSFFSYVEIMAFVWSDWILYTIKNTDYLKLNRLFLILILPILFWKDSFPLFKSYIFSMYICYFTFFFVFSPIFLYMNDRTCKVLWLRITFSSFLETSEKWFRYLFIIESNFW